MDPHRLITPFVFFSRRLRAIGEPLELSGRHGLHRLYGAWRQHTGTTTLRRGDEVAELRPGGIALSEPGMEARLQTGGQVTYIAFALEPRIRQMREHGEITINDTQASEPGWRELLGRALPILLPPPAELSGRELLDDIEIQYWRSPEHRFAVSLRLAAWLIGLICVDDRPHSADLAQRYDDLVALRYRNPVTVAELARELGVSASYLTRHYRSRRSCTPGAALRRHRLGEAQKLLASDAGIAEIAARSGYRNTASFIRAFRLATGTPPQTWRRARRIEGDAWTTV